MRLRTTKLAWLDLEAKAGAWYPSDMMQLSPHL
jgi:hypothetical protein